LCDTGVIHDHIQPSELLACQCHKSFKILTMFYIRNRIRDLATRMPYLFGQIFKPVDPPCAEYNLCSVTRQLLRYRCANAATGAGNYYYLSFYFKFHKL